MCAGAVLQARIARLVYGARDPKTGVHGSVVDLFAVERLNHHTEVVSGVLAAECGQLLSDFFAARRRRGESRSAYRHLDREQTLRLSDAAGQVLHSLSGIDGGERRW
jgi:hypothetical protein